MFDDTLIENGFKPMFALIDKSIIEIITMNLQLKLFNNRTNKINIKTQILELDNSKYLLILYIKNKFDNESLGFILENLVKNNNLIHTDEIKMKNN